MVSCSVETPTHRHSIPSSPPEFIATSFPLNWQLICEHRHVSSKHSCTIDTLTLHGSVIQKSNRHSHDHSISLYIFLKHMYIHVLFSSQTDHARAMHEVILRYPRGPPGTRAQGEIRNYDIGQYPVSLGLDSITPALARRTDFPRDQSYHTPTPWGLLDRGRTNPMARKGGRNKRGIKITETAAGRWGHGFFLGG